VDHQPRTSSRTREPTQLAFHASRIIIDVGVLIALGAMSLPFVESPNGSRDSIAADALPALLLLIPIFLITLIPDHTRPVPGPLGWISLVLGIAAFPYAIVKFLDASTVAETLGGTVGLGARLLVFGTFVTLLGIGVGLARSLLHLPSGGSYPAVRPPVRRTVSQRPAPGGTPRRAGDGQSAQRADAPAPRAAPTPADRPRSAPQRPPGTPQHPLFRPEPGSGSRPPGRED
jgi:hypothetical protein